MTVEVRPAGAVTFIRRRPLTSFFLWLFTVGQAFAFAPVVVLWTTGVAVPYWQVFILGSTLVGMLLPAVVITRIVDGPEAVRELWRRAFAVGVPLRWYALAVFGAPLLAIVLAVLVAGPPDTSQIASALISGLLLQLVLTFVPNNWWEEVAWSGFAQARLQERFGSAAKAALVAGPLFALQHVSLAVAAGWSTGTVMMGLLILVTIPFRFLTGWAYNRTGSLFLVGLVHGMGNAVAGGSGFGAGFLPRLYPDQGMLVGLLHLVAFALIGLVVLAATRGRLGLRTSEAVR
jgi:membrane protease YdiL (CAAX protease family)